jgi:Cys-tRNA(Pro)/Cys-tRNA(Cys) deacylase
MEIKKTLAMKLLEGKKVSYTALSYPAALRDAEAIAAALGLPPEQVYKTLVAARPSRKPLLVMLPAHRQLDLKKLARALGEKKLALATHREAEALTGLQVGGISALALLNKGFANFIDISAHDQTEIVVSAGERGLQIRLATTDLIRLTGARAVDVT